MKGILIVIVLAVLGLAFVQGVNMYKVKGDLATRVEHQLDSVDNNSMNSVKQTLVEEAQKLGVALTPDNIQITFEDTEQRTVAQKLVGKKVGTEFTNKRATITVHYTAHILGLPFNQDITNSHIREVEAPRMPVPPEERQLLDPTGASAGVDIAQ